MLIGPLLFLGLLGASLAGVAAPVISFRHRRLSGLARSCAALVGAALIWAWFVMFVGMKEQGWSVGDAGVWLCGLAGAAGAALIVWGWRSALRAPRRSGECAGCGYQVGTLAVCPECGRRGPGGS